MCPGTFNARFVGMDTSCDTYSCIGCRSGNRIGCS